MDAGNLFLSYCPVSSGVTGVAVPTADVLWIESHRGSCTLIVEGSQISQCDIPYSLGARLCIPEHETETGTFSMFDPTWFPKKGDHTGQRMSDSSATFSGLYGPLSFGVLQRLKFHHTCMMVQRRHDIPGWVEAV